MEYRKVWVVRAQSLSFRPFDRAQDKLRKKSSLVQQSDLMELA
jgi:hypothetical protein